MPSTLPIAPCPITKNDALLSAKKKKLGNHLEEEERKKTKTKKRV
jgi:hypothetical protein